jgi:hypothetical protein
MLARERDPAWAMETQQHRCQRLVQVGRLYRCDPRHLTAAIHRCGSLTIIR